MKRIMFVCTGNTCRSAMAECILKKLIKDENLAGIKVSSCGLKVTESGMNIFARKALNSIGIKPRKFIPKQATTKLISSQSATICMTEAHKRFLDGFNNVYTVNELTGLGEVSDPYGLDFDAYKQTAIFLLDVCREILNLLKEV